MALRTLIFAKAPVAGTVKTRLIPALGAEGAAMLAAELLQQTVTKVFNADIGAVELCAAPARPHAAWQTLSLPAELQWSEQGEGDLGARMARAAQRTLQAGERLLMIGTDCPQLSVTHLRDAAAALARVDCGLIPAVDGGYVLLGTRVWCPGLFREMPWSTPRLAAETRTRMRAAGLRWREWPALHDIDEPADLQWL